MRLETELRLLNFIGSFAVVWIVVYLAGRIAEWRGIEDPFSLVGELLIALAAAVASLFVDSQSQNGSDK